MDGSTGKAVSHHKEFDNALNVSRSVPKGISIFPQWHCSSNQFAMHARTCAAAGCCDAGSQSKTRLANRERNKRNREVCSSISTSTPSMVKGDSVGILRGGCSPQWSFGGSLAVSRVDVSLDTRLYCTLAAPFSYVHVSIVSRRLYCPGQSRKREQRDEETYISFVYGKRKIWFILFLSFLRNNLTQEITSEQSRGL